MLCKPPVCVRHRHCRENCSAFCFCTQAAYAKALWSLQQDARYLQAFQQESDNARAHLVALLSVSPSAAQKLLVLLNQVGCTSLALDLVTSVAQG